MAKTVSGMSVGLIVLLIANFGGLDCADWLAGRSSCRMLSPGPVSTEVQPQLLYLYVLHKMLQSLSTG